VVAVWRLVICLDEYCALVLFCGICGDIQIVANGIFAVVNNLSADVMQHTMIEMESFLGQAVFQSLERMLVQIVGDTQRICGSNMLDLAAGHAGEKLIGALNLSGRVRTKYDIALFIQFG